MAFDLIITTNNECSFNGNILCGLSYSEILSNTFNASGYICHDNEISSYELTDESSDIIIISSNTPCVTLETLNNVLQFHNLGNYDITLSKPTDYNNKSAVIYIVKGKIFNQYKQDIKTVDDIVEKGLKVNLSIGMNIVEANDEFLYINSSKTYTSAISILRKRIIEQHMSNGVVFIDPSNVYIDINVSIGEGTVIYPNVFLTNGTSIGKNCTIGSNSTISGSKISDNVFIQYSVITDSFVDSETKIGPFAYIRPGTNIGKSVKVGDFVELKNSNIGYKTSISHLTYIGDSDVGEHVNFGCGTVTVNYDGKKKYRTKIGNNAFIGCNTNLVSPVNVGDDAYIAAGSTITDEVPEGSLAIARARQVIKTDWKDRRSNN